MELSSLALAAAMASAAWLALVLASRLRRVRARRRALRARRAEHRAEHLLSSLGYEVLERQPRGGYLLDADGRKQPVELRADLLVGRGRRRYVAEVKSGHSAPSLATATTRRQLLEYALAYRVDGTLLVDMEQGSVQRVGFPGPREAAPRALSWLCLGVALGAAAARLL